MKVFVLFGLIGSIYCTGSYNPIDARRIPQDVLLQAQNVLDKKNMLYKEKSLDDFTSSITKAEGQVVAGMNYKFTVDLHSGSDIQECQFVIFYQAWTKDFQVTENKCELKHVKRQLGGQVLGGQNSADCSSQQFQTLLPEAVKAVNMMTNSLYHMTPLQMTMCTTQVVSGFMYRFNLAFQPSEKCMNDQDHITSTLLECPPNNNPERTEHYSCSVWDQSWRKPRYQTTCKLIK